MNLLKMVLVTAVLLASLAVVQGQGIGFKKVKLDTTKFVGTWEPIEKGKPSGTFIQFTKDKKVRISEGKWVIARGTYTITGDRVQTALEFDDGDTKKGDLRIWAVNDKELVLEDLLPRGRHERFARRK